MALAHGLDVGRDLVSELTGHSCAGTPGVLCGKCRSEEPRRARTHHCSVSVPQLRGLSQQMYQTHQCIVRKTQLFLFGVDHNYCIEMCSGSEGGSYLRRIDFVYLSSLGLRVMK